jgi:hypothetical protein
MHIWMCTRMGGVVLVLGCLLNMVGVAQAYSPRTHEQTVLDALDYMERQASDEQALREWTTADTKNNAQLFKKNVDDLSSRLANGAKDTDYRGDLYFRYTTLAGRFLGFVLGIDECFWRLNVPFGEEQYLTSMQHFLSLPIGEGEIWPTDGYSYRYTDQQQEDFWAMSIFATYLGGVRIARQPCPEPPRWFPGKNVNSAEYYQNNLNRDMNQFVFPPATNRAVYAYDQFLNERVGGRPSSDGLHSLGVVLHLAQDMTMPHHVIGLLGGGHADYEAFVENMYVKDKNRGSPSPMFRPHNENIAKHLREIECLQGDCKIEDMMKELAWYTLEIEKKEGRERGGHYFPADISSANNIKRAENLLHLAIAANVAIIRKAWHDWKRRNLGKAEILTVAGVGRGLGQGRSNRNNKYKGRGPSRKDPRQDPNSGKGGQGSPKKLPTDQSEATREMVKRILQQEKIQGELKEQEFVDLFSPRGSKVFREAADVFLKQPPEKFLLVERFPANMQEKVRLWHEDTSNAIAQFLKSEVSPDQFRDSMKARSDEIAQMLREAPEDLLVSSRGGNTKRVIGMAYPVLATHTKSLQWPRYMKGKRIFEAAVQCRYHVFYRGVVEYYAAASTNQSEAELAWHQSAATHLDAVLELFIKEQYHFPSHISSMSGHNSEGARIEVKLPVGGQESLESFRGYLTEFGPYRLNEDMTVSKPVREQQSPVVEQLKKSGEELKKGKNIFEGLGQK